MSRTTKTPALDPSVPLAACAVCGREFPLGQMASPSAEPWHEGMPLVCQDRETRCLSRYAKGERYLAPDSQVGGSLGWEQAQAIPDVQAGPQVSEPALLATGGATETRSASLLVYVASPLASYPGSGFELNIEKAKRYARSVADLGCFPLAPHLLLTRFLDDAIPAERELGLQLGLEALAKADVLFVFGEYLSGGMREEIRRAAAMAIPMRWFKGCVPDMSDRDDTDLLVAALGRVAEVTL